MPLTGFFYTSRATPAKAASREAFLRTGAFIGQSTEVLYREMYAAGIAYRKTNLLADYARMKSIAHIDPYKAEKVEAALGYFDRAVNPYRKERGLTVEQAYRDIKTYKTKNYTSAEQEIEFEGRDWGEIDET